MPAGGNFRYLAGAPHPRTGGSLKCSPPGCETPMCSNTTHELKKKNSTIQHFLILKLRFFARIVLFMRHYGFPIQCLGGLRNSR